MTTIETFDHWGSGVPLLRGKVDHSFAYWDQGSPVLNSASALGEYSDTTILRSFKGMSPSIKLVRGISPSLLLAQGISL